MTQTKKNKWILPVIITLITACIVTAFVLIYLEPVRSFLSSVKDRAAMDTFERISSDLYEIGRAHV